MHSRSQGYSIRSLYFDTLYDSDYHEKLDGIELRRKIRLRIYDPASEFAMLEMKQKEGAYQKKRSLRINRKDAEEMAAGRYDNLLRYSNPFAAECYGLMHRKCYRPRQSSSTGVQLSSPEKIRYASLLTGISGLPSAVLNFFLRSSICIL